MSDLTGMSFNVKAGEYMNELKERLESSKGVVMDRDIKIGQLLREKDELEAENERLKALESAVRLLPVEDWVEQHPLTGGPMLVGYYMQATSEWDNVLEVLAALEGKDET